MENRINSLSKKRVSRFWVIACVVCLALALIAGGVALYGVSAEDQKTTRTDAPTFTMVDASLRAVSSSESDNGLRFGAEYEKSAYDTLASGATVTAGTFIMPYDYIESHGEINEENCFTNNVYTWDGKDDTSGVKILHRSAQPFATKAIADGTTDVYKINASVVNMLSANLDREYVAVSYLKVVKDESTQYVFAERGESAGRGSVAELSQSVLASRDGSDTENSVATGYLNRWLENKGGSVTLKLNKEYYVNSSVGFAENATVLMDGSAGYSKSETLSETEDVTIDSVEDLIKVYGDETPTLNGYTYASALPCNETSALIKLDGSATLKYYFDKDSDFVILDCSTANVGESGSNVTLKNPSAAAGTSFGLKTDSTWGWHGNKSIAFAMHSTDSWAEINFAEPVILPTSCDTFSFRLKHYDSANALKGPTDINLWIVYEGSAGVYSTAYAKTVAAQEALNDSNVYKVTFQLTKPISSVKSIQLNTTSTLSSPQPSLFVYDPVLIDYFCAETVIGDTNGTIELNETNATAPLEIDILGKLVSTVYSDEELAEKDISVSYKKLPNGTPETVTLNNGKFTLNPEKESNYEVSYTLSLGQDNDITKSFYVLGYYKNMITSFNDGGTYTGDARESDISVDGNGAMQAYEPTVSANWANYEMKTPVTVTGYEKVICFWLYSKEDTTFSPSWDWFYFYGGNQYLFASSDSVESIQLKQGWNYCEVPFTLEIKSAITKVSLKTKNPQAFFRYDRVALKSAPAA